MTINLKVKPWQCLPMKKPNARLLTAASAGTTGVSGSMVAQLEGRHRAGGGNALRAAVLGANDGLVLF